jgi:hypothetical protein
MNRTVHSFGVAFVPAFTIIKGDLRDTHGFGSALCSHTHRKRGQPDEKESHYVRHSSCFIFPCDWIAHFTTADSRSVVFGHYSLDCIHLPPCAAVPVVFALSQALPIHTC